MKQRQSSAMRGLIIQQDFLDLILSGRKDWELRGNCAQIREPIGLIESGSGLVVGRCTLIDVLGPLSLKQLKANATHLARQPSEVSIPYEKTYAWVLAGAKRLAKPVRYKHPQGAVIWVKLSRAVAAKINDTETNLILD